MIEVMQVHTTMIVILFFLLSQKKRGGAMNRRRSPAGWHFEVPKLPLLSLLALCLGAQVLAPSRSTRLCTIMLHFHIIPNYFTLPIATRNWTLKLLDHSKGLVVLAGGGTKSCASSNSFAWTARARRSCKSSMSSSMTWFKWHKRLPMEGLSLDSSVIPKYSTQLLQEPTLAVQPIEVFGHWWFSHCFLLFHSFPKSFPQT